MTASELSPWLPTNNAIIAKNIIAALSLLSASSATSEDKSLAFTSGESQGVFNAGFWGYFQLANQPEESSIRAPGITLCLARGRLTNLALIAGCLEA
jgi:hypothetical protein